MVSDQGLQCLLTRFSIKNRIKVTNRPDTPKTTNGLVQHILVKESTSIQWVKLYMFYRSTGKATTIKILIQKILINIFCRKALTTTGSQSYFDVRKRKETILHQRMKTVAANRFI